MIAINNDAKKKLNNMYQKFMKKLTAEAAEKKNYWKLDSDVIF